MTDEEKILKNGFGNIIDGFGQSIKNVKEMSADQLMDMRKKLKLERKVLKQARKLEKKKKDTMNFFNGVKTASKIWTRRMKK